MVTTVPACSARQSAAPRQPNEIVTSITGTGWQRAVGFGK